MLVVDAAREAHAIGDTRLRSGGFERLTQRPLADDHEAHGSIDVRQRLDDQIDALVQLETSDRQDVVAEGPGLHLVRQRRRMVQRLGGEAVIAREARRRVARVAEQPLRFGEHFAVEPNQCVAQPDVTLRVVELAVHRAAEIVDRAVLMEQPRHLVRMADEVGRKLGRDHEIDRLAVALRKVDHPPRRGLRQQLLLRIPLERNRHPLGPEPPPAKLADEAADVQLRAAVHQRHLRLADQHRSNHVANRKLMISPSCTTYSLPSSRTSP